MSCSLVFRHCTHIFTFALCEGWRWGKFTFSPLASRVLRFSLFFCVIKIHGDCEKCELEAFLCLLTGEIPLHHSSSFCADQLRFSSYSISCGQLTFRFALWWLKIHLETLQAFTLNQSWREWDAGEKRKSATDIHEQLHWIESTKSKRFEKMFSHRTPQQRSIPNRFGSPTRGRKNCSTWISFRLRECCRGLCAVWRCCSMFCAVLLFCAWSPAGNEASHRPDWNTVDWTFRKTFKSLD